MIIISTINIYTITNFISLLLLLLSVFHVNCYYSHVFFCSFHWYYYYYYFNQFVMNTTNQISPIVLRLTKNDFRFKFTLLPLPSFARMLLLIFQIWSFLRYTYNFCSTSAKYFTNVLTIEQETLISMIDILEDLFWHIVMLTNALRSTVRQQNTT